MPRRPRHDWRPFEAFALEELSHLLSRRHSIRPLWLDDLTSNPPNKRATVAANTLPIRQWGNRSDRLIGWYAFDAVKDRRHLIAVDGPYRHMRVRIRST